MFENKEIKDAEPNKVNDENVQGAENEFQALNSDKDAENVEESKNPPNENNNENTKDFDNGVDNDVAVEESKNTENLNNDITKEFGNGEDDHREYLYRLLRPGEDYENENSEEHKLNNINK